VASPPSPENDLFYNRNAADFIIVPRSDIGFFLSFLVEFQEKAKIEQRRTRKYIMTEKNNYR